MAGRVKRLAAFVDVVADFRQLAHDGRDDDFFRFARFGQVGNELRKSVFTVGGQGGIEENGF